MARGQLKEALLVAQVQVQSHAAHIRERVWKGEGPVD